MASLRIRAAALATLIAAAAMASCGTDATGIDACRGIEQARCQRGPSCPTLGLTSAMGVEECAQFARDRCLHGLPVSDPGGTSVGDCVSAINSDTTCAVVANPVLSPACSFLLGSLVLDASVEASSDAGSE
jgi:hypothetical protein